MRAQIVKDIADLMQLLRKNYRLVEDSHDAKYYLLRTEAKPETVAYKAIA